MAGDGKTGQITVSIRSSARSRSASSTASIYMNLGVVPVLASKLGGKQWVQARASTQLQQQTASFGDLADQAESNAPEAGPRVPPGSLR